MTTWRRLSDTLSWSPGQVGRGYLLHDGTIKTWNVDPYEPLDQHQRWERNQEPSPIALSFDIDPDGGVVTASPTTDVTAVVQTDPRLYDAGQRPVFEDDFDLGQFQPEPKSKGTPDWNFIMSASPRRRLHSPQAAWHAADSHDFGGYTNWDTMTVALIMDNDEPLYTASRELVEKGRALEAFKRWAIRKIVGPHNREQIKDAKEWNAIPLEERQRMKRDNDIAQFGEEAVNIGEGLMKPFEDWANEGKDEDEIRREQEYEAPDLIDPELVNWDELYQGLKDELDENDAYDRQINDLTAQGLGWPTNHDLPTNQIRDAIYRFHGLKPEDDDAHRHGVTVPWEHFQHMETNPENWLSLDSRDAIADILRAEAVQKELARLRSDPTYADDSPEYLQEMAEGLADHHRRKWRDQPYGWDDPRFQHIFDADPRIQEIRQQGYQQPLTDHTWELMHDVWNGRENPYIEQMQQALTQRGYTVEQIAQLMAQKWRWDEDLNQRLPVDPTPPVDQWADRSQDQASDFYMPEDWGKTSAADWTPGMNWQPGRWGKGLMVPAWGEGTTSTLHTWNTDGPEGRPHHRDAMQALYPNGGYFTANHITISPDGLYTGDEGMYNDDVRRYAVANRALRLVDPDTFQRRVFGSAVEANAIPSIEPANALSPAQELREWLADLGGSEPEAPSIHHRSEDDLVQAPSASTADDLPYYPPSEIPTEMKRQNQSGRRDRTSMTRSLYHGTLLDHMPLIKSLGLRPGVGDFTSDAYDIDDDGMYDYGGDQPISAEELGVEPAVFMADKRGLQKALNAMHHVVGKKLGLHSSELTPQHIRNHGLLVKQPGEMGWSDDPRSDKHLQFTQLYPDGAVSGAEDPWWDDDEWTKQNSHLFPGYGSPDMGVPYQAEPGDYITDSQVGPAGLQYLHGPAMMRVFQRELGWPERQAATKTAMPADPDWWAEFSKTGHRLGGTASTKVKESAMTLPQEQRHWEHVGLEGDPTDTIGQLPNGYTIRRHPTADTMNATGDFMHNCWQERSQERMDDEASKGFVPHTLHDEHGLPRAAFYVTSHPRIADGQTTLTDILGMRNKELEPQHTRPLADWASQMGYLIKGRDPQEWADGHIDDYDTGVIAERQARRTADSPSPRIYYHVASQRERDSIARTGLDHRFGTPQFANDVDDWDFDDDDDDASRDAFREQYGYGGPMYPKANYLWNTWEEARLNAHPREHDIWEIRHPSLTTTPDPWTEGASYSVDPIDPEYMRPITNWDTYQPHTGAIHVGDSPITQADATNDPLGKNPAIVPSRQGDPDYLSPEFCPGCHQPHRPDEPCPDSAVRQYQQMERSWYNRDPNALHGAPEGLTDHQADLGSVTSAGEGATRSSIISGWVKQAWDQYDPSQAMPEGLPRPIGETPDGRKLPVPWSQKDGPDGWGKVDGDRIDLARAYGRCLACGQPVDQGQVFVVPAVLEEDETLPPYYGIDDLNVGNHIVDTGALHDRCAALTAMHCPEVKTALAEGSMIMHPYRSGYDDEMPEPPDSLLEHTRPRQAAVDAWEGLCDTPSMDQPRVLSKTTTDEAQAYLRRKYGSALAQPGHALWFQPNQVVRRGESRGQPMWGRGMVHEPTGTVHTWPEMDEDGFRATHADMIDAKDLRDQDCARFWLRPSGEVYDMAGPSSMFTAITSADPRLAEANGMGSSSG